MKLLIRNRGAGNGVEEACFLFFLSEKHTTEKRKKSVQCIIGLYMHFTLFFLRTIIAY